MKKYAVDLISGDRVIDRKTERTVFVDWIEPSMFNDTVLVIGYFEDNGDDWSRTLDHDSTVRMA